MSKYKYTRVELVKIIDQLQHDWFMAKALGQPINLDIPFNNLKQYCVKLKE